MIQANIVEKIKAHILCSVTFFLKNPSLYEIMWKYVYMAQPEGPQMAM
jgi:hypothetical protein